MVYIVGLGPGSKEYILHKAITILEASELIIGFERALKAIDFIKVPKFKAENLKEIINCINQNSGKKFSIVASGDPCFYGISDFIKRNCIENIEIVPGISPFQYMMAKINKSWQKSWQGSLHGREENFIEKVMEYPISIWLTDGVNSPAAICKKLYQEKIKANVYIGENLSYENEQISMGTPEEMMKKEFSNLSVVVIENDVFKG